MKQAWLPLLASALLLASCSGGVDEAKQGVAEFRTAVANKAYADIYRNADAEMRQAGTEEGFVEFMTAMDRKLGSWQSAPQEPIWNVMNGTGGRKVNPNSPMVRYRGLHLADRERQSHPGRLSRGFTALGDSIRSEVYASQVGWRHVRAMDGRKALLGLCAIIS